MTEKLCPSCTLNLPLSSFWKDSKTPNGYRSWCKACCKKPQAERVRNWKSNDPEKARRLSKQFRESQKSKGLCQHCSKQVLLGRTICSKHYVVYVAKAGLGRADNKTVEELLSRFHASPFCPYTGEPLTLGVNAHLDHIKSRKNHPELSGDINNVEWISETANLSKNGFNKDEFIKFCQKISERFA